MTRPRFLPALLIVLASWAGPAAAQNTVIQTENVRYDYAQVLRVTPVYQTLTATRMEQKCDPPPSSNRITRAVSTLKERLRREEEKKAPAANCRTVPVEREFRRPIAYDVDYVYKGAKYRSRLAEDPGNRLRIRVSISPVVAAGSPP
jgi:uncharacterized protein YcfJ